MNTAVKDKTVKKKAAQSKVIDADPNEFSTRINDVFIQQTEYALDLRSSTLQQRKAVLKRFLKTIEKYTPDIVEAGMEDFNKPEVEVMLAEIFPVVHEIKHTLKHLSKWMKAKRVSSTKATFGSSSKVVYEPKGVSLIISPWNYPVNLTFGPLVSALAAGNTAMIKPSEFTPNMAKVISKIVAECFDDKEVAVFEGEVDVSLALLEKPFDHIFFTGSPQVGKSVMAAAAKNLTSVTLELGGKSPVFIDSSADLKKAAQKITWGKCSNNGQTCIAPDYILIPENRLKVFVEEMKDAITGAYGEQIKNNPDYARVVNVAHTKRIKGLLDDGLKNDGEVIFGGEIDINARYIEPTLVLGKKDSEAFINSRLMQEEIFGPVLPIVTYQDTHEAIAHINAHHKPLALYVFSENKVTTDAVIQKTSSGGVCINENIIHFLHGNLPFGGVNNSGIGNSHGEYGFKAFSHERAVLEDKFMSNSMLYPPYTKKVKTLAKLMSKYFS